MRKLVLVALLATLALVVSPGAVTADEGWVIDSFDVVYDVQSDGTIEATETIHADFGNLSKHGIFRYFNTKIPCGEALAGAQQPISPCPSGDYRTYDYDVTG